MVELGDVCRGGGAGDLHVPDDGACGRGPRGNLRVASSLSREKRRLSPRGLEAADDGYDARWRVHAGAVLAGGVAGATFLQPAVEAGRSFHAAVGVLGNTARITNWA